MTKKSVFCLTMAPVIAMMCMLATSAMAADDLPEGVVDVGPTTVAITVLDEQAREIDAADIKDEATRTVAKAAASNGKVAVAGFAVADEKSLNVFVKSGAIEGLVAKTKVEVLRTQDCSINTSIELNVPPQVATARGIEQMRHVADAVMKAICTVRHPEHPTTDFVAVITNPTAKTGFNVEMQDRPKPAVNAVSQIAP